MTGHEYADLVARYIVKNFASRGVKVYREVHVGKTLTGRGRRVDIFVLEPQTRTALAIECKYQGSVGTVDEKIPFALQDLESMRIPVCVSYAGDVYDPICWFDGNFDHLEDHLWAHYSYKDHPDTFVGYLNSFL